MLFRSDAASCAVMSQVCRGVLDEDRHRKQFLRTPCNPPRSTDAGKQLGPSTVRSLAKDAAALPIVSAKVGRAKRRRKAGDRSDLMSLEDSMLNKCARDSIDLLLDKCLSHEAEGLQVAITEVRSV